VSHNQVVGEVFTVVVVGAIALFALVGVASWLTGGSLYDQIGQGGLTGGPGPGGAPAPPTPAPSSAAAQAERDLEIRQMLQARSDRLVRKGERPLDIEAELAKLKEPAAHEEPRSEHDAALAEEVRQLVVARNERRSRRGEPPLDVEAEVARTLAELDPDGGR
jgi:hypothetical protein